MSETRGQIWSVIRGELDRFEDAGDASSIARMDARASVIADKVCAILPPALSPAELYRMCETCKGSGRVRYWGELGEDMKATPAQRYGVTRDTHPCPDCESVGFVPIGRQP